MEIAATGIPDVLIIIPKLFSDERGTFMETWNEREFVHTGIDAHFVQDNLSTSVRHTLRGMHYQLPASQGKLVRVLSGAVFDVALDIRRSSPTFGQWVGVELSAENRRSLWIPAGMAHGFLVTSEQATFFYKCTNFYARHHEHTIRWNDETLGIDWPIPPGTAPLLSKRDAAAGPFAEAKCFP